MTARNATGKVRVRLVYASRVVVYLPAPVRTDLEGRLEALGLRVSDYVRSLILSDLRPGRK